MNRLRASAFVVIFSSPLVACNAAGGLRNVSVVPASAAHNPAATIVREQVLYSFRGGSDGGDPLSTLIADKSGSLLSF
ncbi:MAG TPA: hypothetical protein VFE35_07325 [Candidatus Cybelea sp.]|jgi:hypothetical protein|nr:hypothetical protein [Candidatus Cybelea sp.]